MNDFSGRSACLEAADAYIEEHRYTVDPLYRHTYHAMPPVGWMNDPNGLIYAFGKYHLFYQFHPYSSAWGPMHWGHCTSDDMIRWERRPAALGPDKDYDAQGCFSGTAVMRGGLLYLMYTSVGNGRQQQSIAFSPDGINFTKFENNPVIPSALLPEGASPRDFRDPSVFKKGEVFYSVIASAHINGGGQLLLYKSADLENWTYAGTLFGDARTTKGIYECPNFFELGGRDILLSSPQGFLREQDMHENIHGNLYMTGSLEYSTGAYTKDYESELDGGFDFYAPQTLSAPDGRRIVIAWMQMWGRSMPAQSHGWAGAMTLPRELTLKNGRLYQSPAREIEHYRKNRVSFQNQKIDGALVLPGTGGRTIELDFDLDTGSAAKAGVKLFKDEEKETLVYYDAAKEAVVFDRSRSGVSLSGEEADASLRTTRVPLGENKVVSFRIFLDNSSVEVFVNCGAYTLTGNVYAGTAGGVEFFSEGGPAELRSLDKYDIKERTQCGGKTGLPL